MPPSIVSFSNTISFFSRWQWLSIPDLLRIFLNATITAEETHACHTRNALFKPRILILVCFINELVRLHITVEVIGHKIVVTMISDRVTERRKTVRVAEHTTANCVEDFGKVRVKLEVSELMSVAQVFHVFCQVAEKEDIRFADLTGDFDLNGCISSGN